MSQGDPVGSEEFFERLQKRGLEKACKIRSGPEWDLTTEGAVIATIEALKEMMGGEPMEARIRHGKIRRKIPLSDIAGDHYLFTNFHVAGHHGTNWEEVTVMVFRNG